jgi:hypothetical protein
MDTRRRRTSQGFSEEDRESGNEFAAWRVEAIEATCRVLARDGNYSEAERRLRNWMRLHAETAALLDLLARVCVQQGKLHEAKRSWHAAERLAPGNPRHRAALQKLSDVERRGGRLPLTQSSSRAVILALFAVIVALVVFIFVSHRHAHRVGARQVPGSAQMQNKAPSQPTPAQAKSSPSASMQSSPAATQDRKS